VLGIILLICLIFLIGAVVAGWGLLKMKNWGRWAAIILGAVQLLGFPIFTAIGGVIIYYLLQEDVVASFNGEPAKGALAPNRLEDAIEDLDAAVENWEEAAEEAAEDATE